MKHQLADSKPSNKTLELQTEKIRKVFFSAKNLDFVMQFSASYYLFYSLTHTYGLKEFKDGHALTLVNVYMRSRS